MPYTIKEQKGEYCVYKKNAKGIAYGDTLGCHPTKQEAVDQIGAIESNEKELLKMDVNSIISSAKDDVLSQLAHALLNEGRIEEAEQVAASMSLSARKVWVYRDLAWYLYDGTNAEELLPYLRQAYELAKSLPDKETRIYAMTGVLSDMIYLGALDEVWDLVESLEEDADIMKSYLHYKMMKTSVTFKEIDGQWWFIGTYSNKFEDRHNEILSEASHKEYAEWIDQTGFKPQITLFHLPKAENGFWGQVMQIYNKGLVDTPTMNNLVKKFYKDYALAETEKVIYANGFTVVFAKVYKDKEHIMHNLMKSDQELGMSHGFVPFNISDNIYDRYRSFEFSILPKERAANIYTDAQFAGGKVTVDQKDKEWVEQMLGQDVAESIDKQTAEHQAQLENDGVKFKEDEETPVEEENKEAPVEEVSEVAKIVDEQLLAFATDLKAWLDEKLAAYDERLTDLQKDTDSKIAEQYEPKQMWKRLFADHGPTKQDDNIVKENEKPTTSTGGWDFDRLESLRRH